MPIARGRRAGSRSRIIPGLGLGLGLVTAVLAAGPAFGQGMLCSQRSVVAQMENATTATAVEGNGDLIFVGSQGNGMAVFDVSDPQAPVKVGFGAIVSRFSDLAVSGSLVLSASGSGGLVVIDVSNPASPLEVGRLGTSGTFSIVESVGDLALLGDLAGRVTVINFADPKVLFAEAIISSAPGLGDIAVEGNTLYIATQTGLEAHDLTTPSAPVLLGILDHPDGLIAVDVVGDTAFILTTDNLLQVVDVTDPAAMTILGQVQLPAAAARQVRAFDDRVLVTSLDSGVITVDRSQLAQPAIVGSIGIRTIRQIGMISGRALIASQDFVYMVDPAAIDIWNLATIDEIGSIQSMTASGDIAYATGFINGTVAINIADPANPVTLGSVSHIGFGSGIAEKNGIVFVADGSPGLVVMDFTDPVNPALVTQITSLGPIADVTFVGDYLLAVAAPLGNTPSLLTLDVTVPSDPVVVAQMNAPDWEGNRIYLFENRLVVPHLNEGLALFDMTDPTNPVLLGASDQPLPAATVAMMGDLVISVYRESDGIMFFVLSIINFADPAAPVLVSEDYFIDGALDIRVFGDHLLYTEFDKLKLWDLSNPAGPELVANISFDAGTGGKIASIGSIALIAQGDAGLRIIDMSDCPPNAPCPPDLNSDGQLDFFDLQVFLNWYASGDLWADLIEDGVLDFFDVQAYLGLFAAGCP
jgi:hypothetical protein